MAVGRALGDEIGADGTARPRPVLDEHVVPKPRREARGEDASRHVGEAARRERNDHAHRARRILLSFNRKRNCAEDGE